MEDLRHKKLNYVINMLDDCERLIRDLERNLYHQNQNKKNLIKKIDSFEAKEMSLSEISEKLGFDVVLKKEAHDDQIDFRRVRAKIWLRLNLPDGSWPDSVESAGAAPLGFHWTSHDRELTPRLSEIWSTGGAEIRYNDYIEDA